MTITPTVSVVIPCYNAAPFLRETIDSVLNQTRPASEVIVVDDGSTDDSAAIAASYGPPVRVIRQENQGESVARNRGMDEAQGDWVALLDADDRWLPHKLERQIDALREAPDDAVCVYSDFVLFGSENRRMELAPWPQESERRVRMLTNPVIQPGTALIRKSAAQKVRFPVGISDGEDQVFWMLLCDRGRIIHLPEVLLEYRKYAGQQTSRPGHGVHVIEALWGWAKAHPEAFSERECQVVRTEFGRQLVGRHDHAYWENAWATVEKARSLYQELVPDARPLPPLFERESPTRTMRIAHVAWNTLLDIFPTRLRLGLWRASRSTVNRIKRGRATT